MSFVDDLNKAVGIFKQGTEDLAVTSAFNRASAKIQELRQQGLKEMEEREQSNMIAQQLSQELLQSGAPVSRVQAAFQAFSAAPLTSAEDQIQVGVQSGDQGLVQQGQTIQREQSRVSMEFKSRQATRKAQADANKSLGKEFRTRVNDRQKEFNRLTAKNMQSLDQANAAVSALKLKNPVADSAIKTMLAKASGEVGNLTEAEREMFAGSPALQARAARLLKLQAVGTLPEADRRDLQELLTLYQTNAKNAIQSRANVIAGQLASGIGESNEQALERILPGGIKTIEPPQLKPEPNSGTGPLRPEFQSQPAGVNNLRGYLK